MNSDRINLKGSADTPGLFSESHTMMIHKGPGNAMMDEGVPDGPGSQGEAITPTNFNKGLYQASADGKLNGEFKELVDDDEKSSGVNKNAGDGGIYARSCFNMNKDY